jgi:hypothetical protein
MIIAHFGGVFRQRVSEWLAAVILASWGLMLLRPEVSFGSSSFDLLLRIAGEHAWGWACLAVGLVRIAALGINGLWRPSYHFRAATAMLSVLFWLQITLSFFGSGHATTGLAVYPWLLLTDVYNIYRAAQDWRCATCSSRAA